ncbi:MAG: TIGR04013 family B12-binding domain/radical SAM domain-containing protein [Calditrichia bacterium]
MAPVRYLAIRLQKGNRFTFPLLLSLLEKEGLDRYFRIIFLDSFHSLQQFVKSGPEGVLLYSFMTPHLPQVMTEVEWIRAESPASLILLAGGPHATGNPESALKMGFDYAYAGPAETGFSAFIRSYLRGDLPDSPALLHAPDAVTLDEYFPLSRHVRTSPPLEITRGCNWNCKFCQTSCQKAIQRSLDSVKIYHSLLKQRNHHRRVNFVCPSAFEYGARNARQLNYDAVREMLEYCRVNGTEHLEYGIFPSEARPNSFSEAFVDLIVKYCSNKKVTIGAQSGSDRVLHAMRRGHSCEDVENACELTHRRGLIPLVDFIFGFPGENRDDRWESLIFIKRLAVQYGARIHVHYFIPLSGTELEEANPTPLDYRTVDTLESYGKGGICTNWWKTGRRLSLNMVEMREKLREKQISFRRDLSLIQ